MTRFPRRLLASAASLAASVLLFSACDDASGPPEGRVTGVEAVGGNLQDGTVATGLPQALVIRALDQQGQVVGGARVEWNVESGGGSILPGDATTDDQGRASATWTLGTAAGEQTVVARVGAATTTFAAMAAAGPAVSVSLVPENVVLDAIGATAAVEIQAVDAHDNAIEDPAGTWTSTAPAIATVDDGTITAVAPGTATIQATVDGVTGEAAVSVDPQPAAILVSPPTAQLPAIGASIQFQASARDRNGNPVTVPAASFTWSSSNVAVVTVTATGVARAAGAGSAQVRAALGTVTGEAQVSVNQVADSIRITPRVDTLTTAGPTTQLLVAATDVNGQPIGAPQVTWSSGNAAIAAVSATGQVSAVGNGTTFIRGVSGNARDSITIVVRLNTVPNPVADGLATGIDTQLTVAAPGLLANDTLSFPVGTIVSFGGGSLTGTTVASTAAGSTVLFGTGGSLTVHANGSLTFMPSAGFTGTFVFLYRVQNAAGIGDGVVTIAVGLAPGAVDDAYATGVNAPLTVALPGVLANDTPGFPAATVLSFGGGTLFGDVTSFAAGQRVAFGIGGSVQLNADGSLAFTPPLDFTGPFTFNYRMSNGLGTSDATITVNVN